MSGDNNFNWFDPQDIQKNKGFAAVAYILFFIPLIACPNSKFGKFHANQGLLLLITALIGDIAFLILSCFPFIGWWFHLALKGWRVLTLILFILGIVNAINGEAKELPVIGKYTIIK